MTPALKELEVSQGKGAGPTHRSCKAESDDVPPDNTWSPRTMEGEHLSVCLSQGWIREGLMIVEVLELGFPGQEGGEVGERKRELQGKDTKGRDLRCE